MPFVVLSPAPKARFSAAPHVESAARACLDCGFIWAETDAKELAKFVATKCKPAAKARE